MSVEVAQHDLVSRLDLNLACLHLFGDRRRIDFLREDPRVGFCFGGNQLDCLPVVQHDLERKCVAMIGPAFVVVHELDNDPVAGIDPLEFLAHRKDRAVSKS